ncbi:MAG: 30S ribosome-binding factor RbfA [Rhodobacteraceae bacterium]|nr:30S ribosome-binding factor RbfA [Paracoccaceae bacterium]
MAKNRFENSRGSSQRQLRVGELIRRALSDVLMRGDIHDDELSRISITVGEVRVTPDLRIATAFVLPLGGHNADELVKLLAKNKYEIRRAVTALIKMKHSPDLRFLQDRSYDQMDETRRLLSLEAVQRDLRKPDEDDAE